MPEDAVQGWRRDVVEAVRAMKPGVIRFGGTAVDVANAGDFEWRDTIGDPDRRKPLRAWGGLQPTGPGIEEIVQFCRLVDAEPLICVRIVGRTARDAADQVEYFNGGIRTPMGALRARNGHPEPYRIRYWQVGNEQSGADYEKRLPEFCRAMKQVDPSIELLSSYPKPGVIRGAGNLLDFVSPHHYDCADLAGCEIDLESIRNLLREQAPGGGSGWRSPSGTRRPAMPVPAGRGSGPSRMRWPAPVSEPAAPPLRPGHDRQPVEYRQQLLLGLHPDRQPSALQDADLLCPDALCHDGRRSPAEDRSAMPVLSVPDLSATLSTDGKAVVLMAINDRLEAITRSLDFSAFGREGQSLEVWTLTDTKHAGEPDVTNGFGDPERVVPVRSTFAASSPRFDFAFPPLSLIVLRWVVR